MRDHQNQSGGCMLVAVALMVIAMWLVVAALVWIK
jgi:hypothetical protein